MKYVLEHMRGVAGVDEEIVECHELTDSKKSLCDPQSPAYLVMEAVLPGCDWPIKMEYGKSVLWSAENPNEENRAGKYCDYWMLSKEEEEV